MYAASVYAAAAALLTSSTVNMDFWQCNNIICFLGVIALKLYILPQNWHPLKNPLNYVFWACRTTCRNLEIIYTFHHRDTNSHLLFQKWSKSVQYEWPKGTVFLLLPEKNTFSTVWWNLWGYFLHNFCVIPHFHSSLIFRVLYKSVKVLRVL